MKLLPHIAKWDAEGGFNAEHLVKTCRIGINGCLCAGEVWWSGMDYNALAIVCEELERGDTAFRTAVSVHTGLNSMTLMQWGTEEQKEQYLVPQAKGEKYWCIWFN